MPIEDYIIHIYCTVDDFLKTNPALRTRGPSPQLTDAEVITIEIVGEFLGLGSDKRIFSHFKQQWHTWFPKLGSRTTFTRQSANLWALKEQLRRHLISQIERDNEISLFDGFPIPTCHIKRVKRRNPLKGQAAFGYCAAKEHKYFGFKGHVVTNQHGLILNFTFTAANIDERDVLPELSESYRGFMIADKGLIRPELTRILASHDLCLQTPLRSNMKDPRPKHFVQSIMNVRRRIESVIGQLVERFKIQSIKAKDVWHLATKTGRKVLAHTFAFLINDSMEFDLILN